MNNCETHSESSFHSDPFSTAKGPDTKSLEIPLNLLVVDDDEGVRNVLATILRRASYAVHCANDGEEAWSLLSTGDYDGVITDYKMPRLSGLDLLRRVRATHPHLPVILISGRMPGGEADLEELISPGMVLDKPFSFDKLLAAAATFFTRAKCAAPLLNEHASANAQ